jgi:hypothetical protein
LIVKPIYSAFRDKKQLAPDGGMHTGGKLLEGLRKDVNLFLREP